MDEKYGYLDVSDTDLEENPYILIAQFIFSGYQFIAGMAGLVIIILLFVKGFDWYWESAYPMMSVILAFPIVLSFPIGLILAIFRRTRGISGLLILVSSLLFFSANWLQVLGFAYLYAGKIWMVVGFALAGVGVFFIAFVGALVQGAFLNAFLIVVAIAISFSVYWLGMFLTTKHARDTIISGRLPLRSE